MLLSKIKGISDGFSLDWKWASYLHWLQQAIRLTTRTLPPSGAFTSCANYCTRLADGCSVCSSSTIGWKIATAVVATRCFSVVLVLLR